MVEQELSYGRSENISADAFRVENMSAGALKIENVRSVECHCGSGLASEQQAVITKATFLENMRLAQNART